MHFDSPHAFCQRLSHCHLFDLPNNTICRSHLPRDLRCGSAVARLLRLWVRIPPAVWMFVCCECRVLSGRGLCDKLITLPGESCRLWCVVVCDLETTRMRRTWPAVGCRAKNKQYLSAKVKVANLLCSSCCCHIFLLGLYIPSGHCSQTLYVCGPPQEVLMKTF